MRFRPVEYYSYPTTRLAIFVSRGDDIFFVLANIRTTIIALFPVSLGTYNDIKKKTITGNNVYAKFWVEKQRALWYF